VLALSSCSDSSTDTVEVYLNACVQAAYDKVSRNCYLLPRKPYQKGMSKDIFERGLRKKTRKTAHHLGCQRKSFLKSTVNSKGSNAQHKVGSSSLPRRTVTQPSQGEHPNSPPNHSHNNNSFITNCFWPITQPISQEHQSSSPIALWLYWSTLNASFGCSSEE
jgi:hypothetical protein